MSYSLAATLTFLEVQYGSLFAGCSGKIRCKPKSFKEYLFKYTYFKCQDNKLIVEPTREDLKRLKNSLFLDFEHFYIKSQIQYTDYLMQSYSSKTWNIVTYYYFLFFSVTTLCKYTGHSCIYFTDEEFKIIKDNIIKTDDSSMGSGLYVYSVEKHDELLQISLSKDNSGMAIHEKTWHIFYDLIGNLIKNLKEAPTEKLLVEQIKKFMDRYKKNFPSILRNHFNYQGDCSINELQNNIPILTHNNLNKIYTINPKANDDYSIKLECLIYIGIFIHALLQELHTDVNFRLSSKCNEFYELQKNFCGTRHCDINTFDNLFK